MNRARFLGMAGPVLLSLVGFPLAFLTGCGSGGPATGHLDVIWGQRGLSYGRLQKPRALAIDARDEIYIVDMTARIQVFNPDGKFLRGWQTPVHENGRPTGLGIDREGRVLVADTHYYQVLIYTREGQLVQKIGGQMGEQRGQFGLVTDVVQDKDGNYYISEYGEWDRIQKFTRDGKFLDQWGGHGSEPGQFLRPQNLEIDEDENIWVADACNHRIQVFNKHGQLLKLWGEPGSGPGQLSYPYDIDLDGAGHIYICEYGNHRVQKFTTEGKSLGCWGEAGRGPSQLFNPWGVVRDQQGRLHVLDTNNHRVQRITM